MLNAPSGKPRTLQARILAGSVVLLSGSTLAAILNLIYNVAVARFLGPTGFGHATVVYTLLTIISAATLAFQIIAAKVVAQQSTAESKSAVYRALHRDSWIAGSCIAILLILFEKQICAYLHLPSPLLIVLLAVGAAFYVPLGTRRGYSQGEFGFRGLATNLVVEGAVRLGGSLAAVLLGTGVTGVIAANALAMAVSWMAIAPKLTGHAPNPIRFRGALQELSQAVVFFAGQVLINNYSIVLVKHYFIATEAGMYAAIVMVGRVIFLVCSAVVNSMFPLVAGTTAEERKKHSVLGTSLCLVAGIGFAMCFAVRVTPARVWSLFLGSKFIITGHYSLSALFALFGVTTVIYSLSVVIISYEMSYKIANTSWVQLAFSGVLIAAILRYHDSLHQVIMVQLVLMVILLLLVGIPFMRDAKRNAAAAEASEYRPVRLVRRVSEDEVIAEFLRSDFDHPAYRDYQESMKAIVTSPRCEDPGENAKRRALLFLRHLSLWKELPSDTQWYEAEIKACDLEKIQVFPRAQWRRTARGDYGIIPVVERLREQAAETNDPFIKRIAAIRAGLRNQERIPGAVVLIGLNESAPFTIIDGNHRFAAAVLEGRTEQLRFLCGLSPRMTRCCWYRTNLLTLSRYGRNLLRQLTQHPEVELARLFENP